MPVNDMDLKLEKYRHKKYRKRRIRFYGLTVLATMLFTVLVGVVIISIQPIDVTNIHNAENALEVVEDEYGETYIITLNNLPTIGYESQYQSLKTTYLELMEEPGGLKDKDKLAVDMVAFVEYVQNDAVSESKKYSLMGTSKEFNQNHEAYVAENGEVYATLIALVDSHRAEDGGLTEEEIRGLVADLDTRMEMYTNYLTTLKNA